MSRKDCSVHKNHDNKINTFTESREAILGAESSVKPLGAGAPP